MLESGCGAVHNGFSIARFLICEIAKIFVHKALRASSCGIAPPLCDPDSEKLQCPLLLNTIISHFLRWVNFVSGWTCLQGLCLDEKNMVQKIISLDLLDGVGP